jgi:hypothetical protein
MKRFQWRGLGDPSAIAGIAWLVTPTIALVDAVFDENEELKSQWEGDGRPPYLLQDDRETEDRLYFRRAPGIDFEDRADLEERLLDLVFDDAAENDVIEIRREHFYKTVAGIYRSASRGRGNPVSAVAKAYDAPRTSAANWVREARVRGYLPPTTKGRAT